MTWPAPRRRVLRWRPEDGEGLEHLEFGPEGDDLVARGVVIGARDAGPYGVDYTIVCDRTFAVRELHLGTTGGSALFLRSDGAGSWRNHDDRPLPEFDGCIDVDLAGSPFTNTLPIRRIDWASQPGGRAEITTLYVPFDSFAPTTDRQIYTRLDERRFRYEAADGGFTAEVSVDEDGFVVEYPGLFARVG
jgi:hypothetical protein